MNKLPQIEIGLHAVIVAVKDNVPMILTVDGGAMQPADALPYGPFNPIEHRTMEAGLRLWVEAQTHLTLGYVEQLYTFGDRGRLRLHSESEPHFVSVGYLALVHQVINPAHDQKTLGWRDWYQYFPWEDWRDGVPPVLAHQIWPLLINWANSKNLDNETIALRLSRLHIAFGCRAERGEEYTLSQWDEERVLERYELIYEAGLVSEAVIDGVAVDDPMGLSPGQSMIHDHRRILATAMARLRAKLKYRPVVFELLPNTFTLTELQQTVECLSGRRLHKQNFRRLVEKAELVEPTGATTSQTGGRPAAIFRFKSAITRERPAPGLKLGR